MIYSTNRTASLGEITCDVNESYFGIGAMSFMEEAAHDELAIFEAAIKSDIDEVMIGESADELSALNEGFVQTAGNKIKEMMKKFIDWIASVMRSAYAKLAQLLVRDNAKFAAMAKKQILKMKNKSKFVYKGKYLSGINDSFLDMKETEDIKKDFDSLFTGKSVEAVKADLETQKQKAEKLSVQEALKDVVKETENGGLDLVESQLKILEELSKKSIKDLKKKMESAKKEAAAIAKKAESMAKEAKEEDKATANAKAEAAALFKVVTQKNITFAMGMIKAQAKIARAVVAKAMGATPKNESAEYDEELTSFMIEAANYEYDEALNSMSEGKDCEDCDSEDDTDDADEE